MILHNYVLNIPDRIVVQKMFQSTRFEPSIFGGASCRRSSLEVV